MGTALRQNPIVIWFLRLDNVGLEIGDCFVSTTSITVVFYALVTAASEVVGSHVCGFVDRIFSLVKKMEKVLAQHIKQIDSKQSATVLIGDTCDLDQAKRPPFPTLSTGPYWRSAPQFAQER